MHSVEYRRLNVVMPLQKRLVTDFGGMSKQTRRSNNRIRHDEKGKQTIQHIRCSQNVNSHEKKWAKWYGLQATFGKILNINSIM